MEIPQHILDQLAYADCSVCGRPVMVKGRGTHVLCSIAHTQALYGFPQTFIVGYRDDTSHLED